MKTTQEQSKKDLNIKCIDFKIGNYTRVGQVSQIRIFGLPLYLRIGNIISIFGIKITYKQEIDDLMTKIKEFKQSHQKKQL